MGKLVEQAKRNEIKACLLNGLSMRKTARRCGVGYRFVANEQQKHNLPKSTGKNPRYCSASKIKKIRKLYAQGKTVAQVAAECNVCRATVSNHLLKRPLSFPKVSDTHKQQIIKLALEGVSEAATARICKLRESTVNIVKFLNDIHSAGKKTTRNMGTVEKIYDKLRTTGDPLKKIAADCGVSVCLVEMIKKEFRIDSRCPEISDDTIDKITKCIGEGMSISKTANVCGVSTSTVRKVCKARDLTPLYPRRIAPGIKQKLKRRVEQGDTWETAAKAHGVSLFCVQKIKKAANVIAWPSKKYKEVRFVTHSRSKKTDCTTQKMKQLLVSGMSVSDVAITCGRCVSTVMALKNNLQLSRQPAHPSVASMEEVKKLHEAGKDTSKVVKRRGASIAIAKRVNCGANAQAQPAVKKEKVDSLAPCAEIAPGITSAPRTIMRIEFLDEIPFCILI
ncbi:hypothetical protein BC940DRAFT_349450 [Gongronella butleri]|nr:hypothetical protein BC940DRAFT_349450 [Gongronella butleri]